jgi:hypothetical protein
MLAIEELELKELESKYKHYEYKNTNTSNKCMMIAVLTSVKSPIHGGCCGKVAH